MMSAHASARSMCKSFEAAMRNRYRILFAVMLASLMMLGGACKRNEIKVTFQLPQSVSDAYRMVYYASDPVKGWYVETVGAVQAGKGEIVLRTRYPSVVFFPASGMIPRCAFYAERGDKIKITGDNDDPWSWTVKGNKITDAWTQWRLENVKVLKSGDVKGINAAVTKFVDQNPDKPLAAILLLVYYDRRADEAGFRKAWKKLKDDALQPKWLQLVGRTDLLDNIPAFKQPVEKLIVASIGNGVDTLRFKGKPLMIYFWRDEDEGRNENMERFRKTADAFGDSSARVLADISFDPDSSGWAYRIRRDTVKKAVRGWIFRGEADSVISRLQVPGTPWFVVGDKSGKLIYEGPESTEADSVFRTLMK